MNYAEAIRIMPDIIRRAEVRGLVRRRTPAEEAEAVRQAALHHEKIGSSMREQILQLAGIGLPFSAADLPELDPHHVTRVCRTLIREGILNLHRAARPKLGIGITYILKKS